MAPEMYEERYDEAVDVYAFGMCMLEMATSEYPYNECSVPAQIYKKVVSGVKPASYDKVTNEKVKHIISQCIQLQKDDRPSCKDLLNSDFFSDDIGIILQPLSKEAFLNSVDSHKIEFRLRLLDSKQRIYKHKENEAIQFEFDIGVDNTDDIASDMFNAKIISEEDSKTVAKLLKVQISAMLKERRENTAQNSQRLNETAVRPEAETLPSTSPPAPQLLTVPQVSSPVHNRIQPIPDLTVPVIPSPVQSPHHRPSLTESHAVIYFIIINIRQLLLFSSLQAEHQTPTGTRSKRSSRVSDKNIPKLQILSVDEDGRFVECSMENLLKTITFKFDINDVNPLEVANDLVSSDHIG